jgi:putative membrane protein (TIGR04086 family)
VSDKAARRAARARAASGDTSPQRLVEIKGDPAFFRRINPRAVLAGFGVALVLYLALSYLLTLFGGSPATSVGAYFGVSAVAMYAGGLTAGMIEPKYGVLNGPLVAVLFILVTFVLTFNSEIEQVKIVGALGLGPMRVDKVFATDLPQLFFSSLGGFTAGMIEQRGRRRRETGGDGGESTTD